MDYISHNPLQILVLISGESSERQVVVIIIATDPALLNSTLI